MPDRPETDALALFHPAVRTWFASSFDAPTRPQILAWPAIARGDSTLVLAPTGTGKTLAAFLWAIDRIMFAPVPAPGRRCRVLYVSPIKALAVDIDRNLRAPIADISAAARDLGADFREPSVAVRTGDTPVAERTRFARHPADILITTPESLYLLLTSNAREALRSIETVILDEIHALTPTKRGSHLALSLERLEHLCGRRLQRIGLSATQRPLEEVAHFLAGAEDRAPSAKSAFETAAPGDALDEFESAAHPAFRPVSIVDAGQRKRLDLRVEVPIEDMSRLDQLPPTSPDVPARPSIWSAINPTLLELVRQHRSTLIFVNARRLAERISAAINDLAGETLVRSHHGSVALSQRQEIEERLKSGELRGLVATSSLELGIDMGAIDLVVQIESPPSVASGMQRIGRASHQVNAVSNGILFPKFRADLLACAAITRAMYDGEVEAVRYPRNPLDVLAQQIVAAVAMDDWEVDALFALVRRAAPYAALPRPLFESVLDMLAGRYPSDEFAGLRPRITWDRVTNRLTAREGARSIAVVNGGTIPDRGLYGVFLAGAKIGARVGELDEEMVFESRVGDVIVLGASSWRIDEITRDRVIVSPAAGQPGKMPFWHGDAAGRPAEFGRRIGEMTRRLAALPRPAAFASLVDEHSLDAVAAENLLRYLDDQAAATMRIPSDEDIVIERMRDELGDWRICVLSPYGQRVHAPWCMAVTARVREETGIEAEAMWADDGFVLRLPETEEPIETSLLLPDPATFRQLVLQQLGGSSVFAARFREAAGRALLLPKRRPGTRSPLWAQRKRAGDLLSIASRYEGFPLILEAYRECVRDAFDLASAAAILRDMKTGRIRVTTVDSEKPSPFASALLFFYVANYVYEGDAPLAERRAQALSIDQSQLEELLGDTDFRELLDPAALAETESQLQLLDPDYHARHADAVHDMLLRLGDLSDAELAERSAAPEIAAWARDLLAAGRILRVRLAAEDRYIAVEDAARYRDALAIPLPPDLPPVWLQPSRAPLLELVRRYARTHGPFTTADIAARFGAPDTVVEPHLKTLHAQAKLLEGEFCPRGSHQEWIDPEVLRTVRRRSLARLRKEVEPAEQRVFARLLTRWQGVIARRKGATALLDAIDLLQGAALPAYELEREILPARVAGYQPADLDALLAAGEVIWVGRERVGEHDGRIALYLAQSLPLLHGAPLLSDAGRLGSEREQKILQHLAGAGASFFPALHDAAGGGFPGDTLDALWELVWAGVITNDTFHPLRALIHPADRKSRPAAADGPPGSPEFLRRFRARTGREGSPSHGRWSLLSGRIPEPPSPTRWTAAIAQQFLVRYGIVMRETAVAENLPGGYGTIYPALRAMEESGWVRRGMFVAAMGAAQFASPSAVDTLRSLRNDPEQEEVVHLAAADPANAYGALLPWPREESAEPAHGMARAAGASVILVNGALTGFLRRRNPALRVFLPDLDPDRTRFARALARKLADVALSRQSLKEGLFIGEINGAPAGEHFLAPFLEESGFLLTAFGYQMRRREHAAKWEESSG
jgi:ATP-dependent Lhr-like helicase